MRLAGLIAVLVAFPDLAPAQEFFTLKGHGGPIMGLAVSPAGQVASASFDNSVALWQDGAPVWLEGHDAAVVDLVFAGPDRLISGGDDFAVISWVHGNATVLGHHRGKVTDIAVSPDGRTAASASWDGSVMLWPLTGGEGRVLDRDLGNANDVAFSSDGARLYVASATGLISVYDLGGAAPPRPLVKHGFGVNAMILGPGEGWLAYGAVDGVTRVIDPADAREVADFSLDRRPILAMAYSAAANLLAVGDGHGYIMVIDTAAWKIVRDFRAMREGPVWALAFSPDGATVYAGGLDPVVYAWPVAMLDEYEPAAGGARDFLRKADTMSNGERQFMRKCSICHSLTDATSRKAGPTLRGLFGRRAGTVPGYRYSPALTGSEIVWSEATIDALFELGPDHYLPGTKMPMQRIAGAEDRSDLIGFLRGATRAEN